MGSQNHACNRISGSNCPRLPTGGADAGFNGTAMMIQLTFELNVHVMVVVVDPALLECPIGSFVSISACGVWLASGVSVTAPETETQSTTTSPEALEASTVAVLLAAVSSALTIVPRGVD